MHELEIFINICSQTIGALVAIVVGFLSIAKSKFGRVVCFTLMIVFAAAEIFFLGMAVSHFVRAAPEEHKTPNVERARVSPPQPRASPKQEEDKVASEDKPNEPLLRFNVSSKTDPSIRHGFCIDSDFSGTISKTGHKLLVTLDRASLELCKYSADTNRDVQIWFGFGTNDDITRENWRALNWSDPEKGSLSAGQEVDLKSGKPIPILLTPSLQKRLSKSTAGYGVVVRVYNRDRNGLYYLRDR